MALSLQPSSRSVHAQSPLPHSPFVMPQSKSASSSPFTNSPLPTTLPIDSRASTPLKPAPALDQTDPIFAGVNEMREQRMSMVANYRQYVCVHECLLVGALELVRQDQQTAQST